MLKKILSFLMLAVFFPTLLCACGKDESSEDIYYGQAMKEVNGKDIYLIYDGRFITDDEMDAVINYYDSIQNKDYQLFKSTQSEVYIDYMEGKENTSISVYVDEFYDDIKAELGDNFDFTQIEVTDCGNSSQDNEINNIKELMDGIYSDAGKEKSFSETIKDSKFITINITSITENGEEYNLPSEIRYIFNCEDGIFIF